MSGFSTAIVITTADYSTHLSPHSANGSYDLTAAALALTRNSSKSADFDLGDDSEGLPVVHDDEDEDDSSSNLPSSSQSDAEKFAQTFFFMPMLPTASNRYTRSFQVPRVDDLSTVERLTIFPDPEPPHGWIYQVDPQGQPYFYHNASESTRYITEANLFDRKIYKRIHRFVKLIDRRILDFDVRKRHSDIHVVLELVNSRACRYYMVDNSRERRSIFWLDDYYLKDDLEIPKDRGLQSLTHLKYYMHHQYWIHCERYPHCLNIQEDLVKEMAGILLYSSFDSINSSDNTASFSRSDLLSYLDLLGSAQTLMSSEDAKPYIAAVVSRLMSAFAKDRFLHFYGQPSARLTRQQSLHEAIRHPRTLLVKAISPFLFFGPDLHLRQLQAFFIDEIFYRSSWPKFIENIVRGWTDFILYSTVLLASNIGFLAIPGLNDSADATSVGQTASLCSMVTSIGCIIIGMLLIREDRTEPKDESPHGPEQFLKKLISPATGFEPLAILYSLPYALFMWSMVSFAVAVGYLCFRTPSDIQRIITGVIAGAVAIMVLWEVKTLWKSWQTGNELNRIPVGQLAKQMKEALKEQ